MVLVPLLHCSKHLLLVCTDDVHVLRGGGERERELTVHAEPSADNIQTIAGLSSSDPHILRVEI